MFQTNDKVEDGRVRAHETAEAAVVKVHELIDKVAEQTEHGSERAQELKASASEQAAAARETAATRAADLRDRAEEAKEEAAKDAQKRAKAAKKRGKSKKKQTRKQAKKAGKEATELRDHLVETASGLAAAGVAAGRKAADEAAVRGPEVVAALRDERDTQAAIDAAKGKQPTKKKRTKLKLFLLALVAGGIAAVVAKQKQGPKKDPWAVPAGDPYKAPTTGRDSSLSGGVAAAGVAPAAEAAETAPTSDPLAAPTSIEEDPLASAPAPVDDTPQAREQSEGVEGTDAWSSARDWADNSDVPSTTGTSEGTDLSTDNLGGDLPVDGDSKA